MMWSSYTGPENEHSGDATFYVHESKEGNKGLCEQSIERQKEEN